MTSAEAIQPSPDPDPDSLIGEVIFGDLEVTERIAHGGTGTVYKAVDPSTQHRVAVKVLTTKTSAEDDAYRCFRNEVLSLARITHPHAVRLYDWGRTKSGHWYIVMELLEGQSLDQLLKDGPLPLELSLKILDDVAAVLEQAHDLGIVHRDIKPANIMLQRVGSEQFVRVLDFGIARLTNQPNESDRPSGTPAYMAPEQIFGVDIDGRADIYALGVVAYECFGGNVPFAGISPNTVLAKHVHEEPAPLVVSEQNLNVPPGLTEYVARLLDKNPDARPQTMRAVRRKLAEFLSIYNLAATSSLSGLRPIPDLERPPLPWLPAPPDAEPPPSEAPSVEAEFFESKEAQTRSRGFWAPVFGIASALVLLTLLLLFGQSGPSKPSKSSKLEGVTGRATVDGSSTRMSSVAAPPIAEPSIAAPSIAAPPPLPEPAAERADLVTAPVKTRLRRKIRRAPSRSVRVCYELMGSSPLSGTRLFVDGRLRSRRPDDQCFVVTVSHGRHTFTLVADPGVRRSQKQRISGKTEGVFFLID